MDFDLPGAIQDVSYQFLHPPPGGDVNMHASIVVNFRPLYVILTGPEGLVRFCGPANSVRHLS